MLQINLPIFSANSAEGQTKDVDYVLNKASTVGGYIGTDGDTAFKVRYTSSETIYVYITDGFTVVSNKIAGRQAYKVLPVMIESFKAIIQAELD